MKTLIHSILLLLIVSLISCSKNKGNNDQLNIKSASEKKATNVIFLVGDGLGIPLITAAYNEKKVFEFGPVSLFWPGAYSNSR
jgi:alkaline phosphatase